MATSVTVSQVRSFAEAKKEYGTAKLAECVNKETGETFKAIAFDNGENIRFCHFGASIPASCQNANWLRDNAMRIQVGVNSNHNLTAFVQGNNAWELL